MSEGSGGKTMDRKTLLAAGRDFLLSAGIGWIASQAILALLRAQMSGKYAQYVWFDGFLSVMETMVWFTAAGLVYAAILHRHAKRDANTAG